MNHNCSPIKNSHITKTLYYHVKWILPFYKTYKKYTVCDKLNHHISCGQFTNVKHIHSMYWRHGSISGYWLVNCATVARAKDGAVHKVLGTNVPTWQDFTYVTGTFTDNTHHWHSNAILTFSFPRIFNVLQKNIISQWIDGVHHRYIWVQERQCKFLPWFLFNKSSCSSSAVTILESKSKIAIFFIKINQNGNRHLC